MALTPVSNQTDAATTFNRINAAIDALNSLVDRVNNLPAKQNAFDLPGLLDQVSRNVAATQANAEAIRAAATEIDGVEADFATVRDGFRTVRGAVESLRPDVDRLRVDLDGLDAIATALNDLVTQLSTNVVAQRFDFAGPDFRPGDTPSRFATVPNSAGFAGDGRSFAGVLPGMVSSGDSGRAVRLTGATILTTRQATPVEPGRVYRARAVVQRRANPSDPSNDSVVLGISWLDSGFNTMAPSNDATIIEDMRDLTTSLGRQERSVLYALSPSPDAQFRAPPRARYARVYVQNFGLDGATDVEVLGIEDVSNATILAPETADTVQRVGALESQNAGQRLNALEVNTGNPNSITFATKSDAASAAPGAIPNTATTVSVRGLAAAGDGGDGLYRRIPGTAPAGTDSFVNQGVTFVRVYAAADVLGALLLSLPTSLPPVAGRAWLNGNTLAVS